MAHWNGRTRETVGTSRARRTRRRLFALVLLGVVSASGVTVLSGTVTRDRLTAPAPVTPLSPGGLEPLGTPAFETAMLSDPQQARPHAAASAGGRANASAVPSIASPKHAAAARTTRAALRHRIPAKSSHELRVRSSVDVIPARRPVRQSVRAVNGAALVSAAVLAPVAASEDAYVQSDVPATNFGTATTLNNVSGTPEARAYLKFNVSGVSGTITKATFRVFTQTSSGSGYELHAVGDNTWTEAGLTYANRPAVGALVGTAVNFTANTWTSVDVTSVVTANGTFSFEMNAVSTSLKKYASKESGANAPQLVLETSAPASQPAAVAATAGGGQTATVGTAFTTRLAARVTDASAQPVAGATVTFAAPANGASGTFGATGATATAVSGSDGVATAPQLTANTTAGTYSVSASVAGVATPATFSLTNAAATGPTTVTVTPVADGYVQSDLPSTNFGTSAVLKNNTTPDTRAYLKFDLSGISGTVTNATFRAFTQTSSGSGYELHQVTDNSWVEPGLTYSNRPAVGTLVGSAVNFTANTWTSVDVSSVVKNPGTFSFEMNGTSANLKQYSSKEGANPPQLVVSYTPTVTPSALAVAGGDGQTATVGTAFATRLAARATDSGGSPVAGAVVRFSAPTSGAGAAFAGGGVTASATTGSDGVATAPQLVANATAGAYQVTASTNGVSSPVTFHLTNASAPPPSTPTAVDVADAYVRSDVPASNFGTSTILIGRTSPEIDSYIKFDVSGLNGAPLRAVLRLWVETTGSTTYKVYQVSDNNWTEDGLVFSNKPAFGGLVATSGATTAGTWVDLDVTGAVSGNGFVTLGFTAGSTAGKDFGSREDASHAPQLLLTPQTPANGDPVIVAAGDIACSPADANYNGGAGTATACHQQATSDLVLSLDPVAVITLGDEQYNSGKLTDFLTSYDPTWGRFKTITHPSIGNHELGTTGASGYFNYFGDNATPLQPGCRSNCNAWYSYSIGNWRIITLNTECGSNGNNCVAGSAQDLWLKSELASANAAGQCKLVSSHHPKWSSSSFAATDIDQLVQDMYDGHADIYLTGHMHGYERFAPQNPAGQLDTANGITEMISGAGGAFFTGFLAIQPNSVVHNNDTYGVLKLILRPHSADYQFVRDPTSGLFSDSGTVTCH
jgi:hypothetical protein